MKELKIFIMKLKHLIVGLIVLISTALSFAQGSHNKLLTTVPAGIVGDSITAGQSVTYDLNTLLANSHDFARDWQYSITTVVDSISGATAGTVAIYVSDAPASATTNVDWYLYDSDTVDGVQTISHLEGKIYGRRCKVVVTNTGATQKNAVRLRATLKDLTPR